ncbi:MAG: 16S rRNA (uracil(1498)-N(3))-methyltransferase [Clostridiales Family XIII bacterium]|jgi:16S rRNA (uracil1498-N3)-methyltransferase|nr:16S rRNA (uracil(1498)-N(3))-methyltransferase [Clostridiales Family XIII bacterium]
MRKFFVDAEYISVDEIHISVKEDVNHILNVLRMKIGDKLIISDKTSWEYVAEIANVNDGVIDLDIISKSEFSNEPDIDVTLFQGIPKGSKMDEIVQKSIEIGVNAIVPVMTRRSVPEYKGADADKKVMRWRKIAAETVKQCRRGLIPDVSNVIGVSEAAARVGDFDIFLLLYESEEEFSLKQALTAFRLEWEAENGQRLPKMAIFIGPEGGIDDTELVKFEAAGAKVVTVGNTILRTETAGPAALAMLSYEFSV